MNILNISTWDNEQFGYQIHKYLQKCGHTSHFAVRYKNNIDRNIHKIGNTITWKIDDIFISRVESVLGLRSLFPISGKTLLFKKYFWESDVIHLHVIHGVPFFSLLLLPVISRLKPIVWTIHDPWIMTGHCIYPMNCDRWKTGCGNCPDLSLPFSVSHDFTSLSWKIKRILVKYSKVTLLSSFWMKTMIDQSPILQNCPCKVVTFGLDLKKFTPKNKEECRKILHIPEDSHVIMFRFMGNGDKLKGWSYIKEALNAMNLIKPTYIITTQMKGSSQFLDSKFNCVELGLVPDHDMMITILSAADILLMPSEAESFGMMAVESMACGTPVIVFNGTALETVVHAPVGGISVPKDSMSLKDAIENLLNDPDKYDTIRTNGLNIVKSEYNGDNCSEIIINLYSKMIKEHYFNNTQITNI